MTRLSADRRRGVVLVSVALVSVSCGHVGVTRLGSSSASPPKAPGCKLDVYVNESDVKRTFEPVCLIDATRGTGNSLEGAIDWTRDDACRCGADAVVVLNGSAGGAFHRAEAQVKAIRYTGL